MRAPAAACLALSLAACVLGACRVAVDVFVILVAVVACRRGVELLNAETCRDGGCVACAEAVCEDAPLVVAVSIPILGHIMPLVALLEELSLRGYRTGIATIEVSRAVAPCRGRDAFPPCAAAVATLPNPIHFYACVFDTVARAESSMARLSAGPQPSVAAGNVAGAVHQRRRCERLSTGAALHLTHTRTHVRVSCACGAAPTSPV
jgi:hypothetical protein